MDEPIFLCNLWVGVWCFQKRKESKDYGFPKSVVPAGRSILGWDPIFVDNTLHNFALPGPIVPSTAGCQAQCRWTFFS